MTTWKASSGAPQWARGSVNASITRAYSTNDPGQPWLSSRGVAPATRDRTCTTWKVWPSTTVLTCS